MSTDIKTQSNPFSEAARETAHRTADAARETVQQATATAREITGKVDDLAGDVVDVTKDAMNRATDTAKALFQSGKLKAEDTLAVSKDYVCRNPVRVVLGAFAFGAAFGCMVMIARRRPTFGERYVDEPLATVREAIHDVIAPMTKRVQRGYDSAMHRFGPQHNGTALSDRIGSLGNKLKFW